MKTILIAVFLLLTQIVQSQYYYNDIIGAGILGSRMKNYVDSKVSSVTAVGYDAQGRKAADFNEWQEISATKNELKISSRHGQQITIQTYHFDDQFNLVSLTDSSGDIKSTSTYTYDNSGHITLIRTVTKDMLSDFNESDEHQWIYDASGHPVKMWRIVNGTDSSEYRFTLDDKGNIADEQLYRRETGINPVYYYYDEKNRVTDIVRYNNRAKRLLPDFMFEYDEDNRIIQKISTLSTINSDYLIWRYAYNDQGLKTKEVLFDKQKQMTGKIEYSYTFAP